MTATHSFYDIIAQIEQNTAFRKETIQVRAPRRAILIDDYFEQWLATIQHDHLEKYYHNFDLNQLQLIVLGSSGETCPDGAFYNSVIALASENPEVIQIPDSITRFAKLLNKSVNLENERGEPEVTNSKYDFRCSKSMKHVLFINACLTPKSTHPSDPVSWVNAVCTIRFVNKILTQCQNKIAVLDIRQTIHTHRDNLNAFDKSQLNDETSKRWNAIEKIAQTPRKTKTNYETFLAKYSEFMQNNYKEGAMVPTGIGQDTAAVMFDYFFQDDEFFKVIIPTNRDHRYVRLGYGGTGYYVQSDENCYINEFQSLCNESFQLDRLFMA